MKNEMSGEFGALYCCHPELDSGSRCCKKQGEMLKRVQHDKGFTLIELLVVVLIIGILAAVALPQYQRAVDKTRMTEAIMAVEAIAKANEMYKMANGNYTNNIHDLDIEYKGDNVAIDNVGCKKTPHDTYLCAGDSAGLYKVVAVMHGRYSLRIYKNGNRYCTYNSSASAYERQLCLAWAAGN